MFSPPPAQYSIAQIEEAKRMREAQEQAKRDEKDEEKRKKEEQKALKKAARKSADMAGSRFSSEYKSFFFGRRSGKGAGRLNISSPVTRNDSETQSITSHDGAQDSKGNRGDGNDERTYLSNASPGSSKKSVVPPRRPARPSFEQSLSSDPEPSPVRWTTPPASPPTSSPPSVPVKSPMRKPSSTAFEDALVRGLAQLDLKEQTKRSTGTPAAPGRTSGNSLLPTATATLTGLKRATIGDGVEGRRLFTVQAGKLDKRLAIDQGGSRKRSEPSIRALWQQAHEIETANKTDEGQNKTNAGRVAHHGVQRGSNLALQSIPDRFVDRELPGTPGSILKTPTEMYARPRSGGFRDPKGVGPKGRRRGDTALRNALATLSDTNARVGDSSPVEDEELSPSGWLTPVPEFEAISENTPPPSGTATPVVTEIHLRGGSIVTVVPPELTAWQRSTYIQGPIRLLKPKVWPRKDSVASLEPFQAAIEQVYKKVLATSTRRRSDDEVVDNFCDWFADFGFDEITLDGDTLTFDGTGTEDLQEEDDDPSPIERTVAKEVVMSSDVSSLRSKRTASVSTHGGSSSRKHSIVLSDGTRLSTTRAQTAEDLRVRGIARLSRYRKQSVMSTASSGVLPITPLGEESMFQLEDDSPAEEKDQAAVGPGEMIGPWRQSEEVDQMECDFGARSPPGAFSPSPSVFLKP